MPQYDTESPILRNARRTVTLARTAGAPPRESGTAQGQVASATLPTGGTREGDDGYTIRPLFWSEDGSPADTWDNENAYWFEDV